MKHIITTILCTLALTLCAYSQKQSINIQNAQVGAVSPAVPFAPNSTNSAVPLHMTYQGVLTGPGGAPVTDGSYNFTIKLFHVSSGGSSDWTDNFTLTVARGAFTAILGSGAALNVVFDKTYYLEVTVTGGPSGPTYPQTLTPRTELTASPYSLAPWIPGSGNDIYFNAGNVGIGTAQPANKLFVRGGITIEGDNPNSLSQSQLLFFLNGNHTMRGWLGDELSLDNDITLGAFSGNLRFWAAGDTRMFVGSTGRVGIGTTDPYDMLHVKGQGIFNVWGDARQVVISKPGGTDGGITMRADSNDFTKRIDIARRDTDLVFLFGGGTVDAAERARITRAGNVGIGTQTPTAKLHIGGTPGVDGIRFPDGTLQTSAGVGSAPTLTNATDITVTADNDNNTSGDIKMYTGTNERMRVANSGNVGIGTTSPEFKLSLDNDGSILAKGTFGSGTSLTTSGAGTRLIWYPKKGAFRAGTAVGSEWDDANIGNWSTAMGQNTTARGLNSTAIGSGATASGDYSTAMGDATIAGGTTSTAMGQSTTAGGDYSTAMGNHTSASSYLSTALGVWNVGVGDPSSWVATDPLLEIGNGTNSSSKANAMTVLKNGNVGIGVTNPGDKLTVKSSDDIQTTNILNAMANNQTQGIALGFDEIRKTGSNANSVLFINAKGNGNVVLQNTATGNVGIGTTSPEFKLSLDSDGGILAKGTVNSGTTLTTSGAGTRLIWYPKKSAFRAGDVLGSQWDDVKIGVFSTAMGQNTTASGLNSTAIGSGTTASGDYSNAMGDATIAGGTTSTAMGQSTTASGEYSTAMGSHTTASSYASTALGILNVGGGDPLNWVATDPLLEIGNGTNSSSKATAMTVLKNGNVGIGTASPLTAKLDVEGNVKIADGTQGLNKVLTSDANGLASWQTPAGGGGSQWAANWIDIYNSNAGKVGIGTQTPRGSLHIVAPSSVSNDGNTGRTEHIRISTDSGGQSPSVRFGIHLANVPGDVSDPYTYGFIQGIVPNTAGFMSLSLNPWDVTRESPSHIGIGTKGPDAPLHILRNQEELLHLEYRMTNNNSNYGAKARIHLQAHAGPGGGGPEGNGYLSVYHVSYDGPVVFAGTTTLESIDSGVVLNANNANGAVKFLTGGSTTARVKIASNGNVGIGTTSPSEKLEVAGNVKIGNATIHSGTGSPEGAVTGNVGDLYLRTDGGAGTTMYVKESGNGTNTGWVGK